MSSEVLIHKPLFGTNCPHFLIYRILYFFNVFIEGYVAPITNKKNQIGVLLKKNFGEEMVNMTTIYGTDGTKSEQSFRKSVSTSTRYVVICNQFQ